MMMMMVRSNVTLFWKCRNTTANNGDDVHTAIIRHIFPFMKPSQQLKQCCRRRRFQSTNTVMPTTTTESTIPSVQKQHEKHQRIEEQRRIQQQMEKRKQLVVCKIYMNVGGDVSHIKVLKDLIVQVQNSFATTTTTATTTTPTTTTNTETTTAAGKDELERHQKQTEDEDSNGNRNASDIPLLDTSTEMTTNDFTDVGALIQIDVDPISNRSSFHIAGPVLRVIDIVNNVILQTSITTFRKMKRGFKLQPDTTSRKAAHKVIDIVEHVSFLPLVPRQQSYITDNKNLYPPHWVPTYTAYASRQVGAFIREALNIQVNFYELAQRTNLSYEAIIERRIMQFSKKRAITESIFVGAFPDFVEDIHVLLAKECGKHRTRELVALLNNKDTGLVDVVATSQTYDIYRWDVHCRLLRPHLTGSNMAAIEEAIKRWNQLQKGRNDKFEIEFFVKCFRIGPTYDECINTLQKVCISDNNRAEHDQEVMTTFQNAANYYIENDRTGNAIDLFDPDTF